MTKSTMEEIGWSLAGNNLISVMMMESKMGPLIGSSDYYREEEEQNSIPLCVAANML